MKWIKRILGTLLAMVVLLVLVVFGVFTAARFHDGPFDGGLAIVAGGAFVEGELQDNSTEPDWTFLTDYTTIEFQLLDPARSRTTWIMEHEGRIFIPSGYMNSVTGKLWKHWPIEAEEDGRALLRVDGKIYERQLIRIQEGDIVPPILAEIGRKYGGGQAAPMAMVTSGDLWLFELEPRR